MTDSVVACPTVEGTGFLCQKYKWECDEQRINVTVLVKLDGKANAFKECYTICMERKQYIGQTMWTDYAI